MCVCVTEGQKERADLHAQGDFLIARLVEEEKDEKDERNKGKMDPIAVEVFQVRSTVRVNFAVSSRL